MKLRLLTALVVTAVMALAACGSSGSAVSVSGASGSEDSASEEAGGSADDSLSDEADDSSAEQSTTTAAPEVSPAPVRIVSLSPAATEMLFAVGAGPQVIAVDEFSDYPPEAPITDLSGWQPNVEAIAGYEPDLVVSESPIEGLEAIGVENLVLTAAEDLDGVYEQIQTVGDATGNDEPAAQLIAAMEAAVAERLATIPPRDVPLTYYHELDTTLYSVTSSTFIGNVYSLFGLENVADAADADGSSFGYPQLNAEYLIDADPDIIFLADTLFENQSAATVAERPGWAELTAVREGRVVELNDDIASRWGPRIVEFIDAVGAALAELDAGAEAA